MSRGEWIVTTQASGSGRDLVRATVAAIIGSALMLSQAALAAEAQTADQDEDSTEEAAPRSGELDEVRVTGSRIVRRDTQSNSPLVTIERERLEDNTYISIEQALNELPQFMVGGAGLGAFSSQSGVGTLGGMEQLDGGAGTGTMFDNARLPDTGGRIGTYTPGAANVNLRGLGSNRSLTLIDGHRGQPTNATGTVDLNTIPSAAIGNIEVITGGASAVYGADALAGVTNIKMRDNFEGISVRVRGGIYEVGDGGEYQASTLMGTSIAGKGNAMIGIEYSKRDTSYYRNRSWFREAMESPFSSFANASFQPMNYYSAGGQGAPSQAAVNQVFADRDCTSPTGVTINCISATNPAGGGFYFNDDGTLFTRSSSCLWSNNAATSTCPGQQQGTTYYYGPQGYKGSTDNSPLNPVEVACSWQANAPNTVYPDRSCAPTLSATDWDRWLGGPREGYTLFGRATYNITDKVRAFSTISFANSTTETRREASPASGGFGAQIPYSGDPNAIYLPSVLQADVVRNINGVPTVIRAAGSTLPEYVAEEFGGTNTRGTSCAPTGGCTMAQAFPVPAELATLLNSRSNAGVINTAGSPFRGLSSCQQYQLVPLGQNNPAALTNPGANYPGTTTPVRYVVTQDPNTGMALNTCGSNAPWAYNSRFDFIPPRGTINTQRTWSLAAGLEGDLPFSDWTWELYTSQGQGQTNTEFQGFVSMHNYRDIMSQPNYGMGYSVNGGSAKFLSCTSGLSPFDDIPISQDCIDAIASNQMDRSGTNQRVHEFSMQGHVADLPAGELRTALGVSYRKNSYEYKPDSLRERDYINDTSAGQFGIGEIDASLSVKEAYAELLIPLLRDLPGVQNLELELGGRYSKYSTGQNVPTWKALMSWQPVSWLRARGGYNRAERAPNIAELFTRDSANNSGSASDPCIVPSANALAAIVAGTSSTPLATVNDPVNPDYLKVQALCAAQITAAGGTGNSEFDLDPSNFGRSTTYSSGITIVSGNPNLKSEKGQTWTVGLVFNSPFAHPLLNRLTSTVDWYEARIDDPIEIPPGGIVTWSCFNAYGDNPNYELDDPNGYCGQIERDPAVGNIRFTSTPYLNRGKLVMRGMDVSMNWSAAMADLGLAAAPGRLSIGINANFLFDQIQAVSAGGNTRDYAGIGGAADFRSNTNVGYSWGRSRVGVTWSYRSGTCIARFGALGCDETVSRYPVTNTFSVTGGTRIGPVNASLSVSNPLNKKPRVATYDWDNPYQGFGTFNPFDDLTGRRWSMNLSVDF